MWSLPSTTACCCPELFQESQEAEGIICGGKGCVPPAPVPPCPPCLSFSDPTGARGYFSHPVPTQASAPCNAPHPVQEQVFTDILNLPWVQARAIWRFTKPVPSAPSPFSQLPAPKGGGSTHVQAPRSMTAVSLPTEHPRDCQPPLRLGRTHTPLSLLPVAVVPSAPAATVALPPARALQTPQEQRSVWWQGGWSLQVQ